MANFNINAAGFIIVGMFVLTWAGAMLVWRYGHIEESWSANLRDATSPIVADALRVEESMGFWSPDADEMPPAFDASND